MLFVIGTYSFRIKTFYPADLHLAVNDYKNCTFEIRQKVFHIMYIPVFPTSTIYVMRNKGVLHETTGLIAASMKLKWNKKSPWYAYLLPILLVTIPLIVVLINLLGNQYLKQKSWANNKSYYAKELEEIKQHLGNLDSNAYLIMKNTQENKDNDLLTLQLISREDTLYNFKTKILHYPSSSQDAYSLQEEENSVMQLSKTQLQQAVCENYDFIHKRKPFGINLNKGKPYYIAKIAYFDQPIISPKRNWYYFTNQPYYSDNTISSFRSSHNDSIKISLELQNFGESAHLIAYNNVEGHLVLTDSLPKLFPRYIYLQSTQLNGLQFKQAAPQKSSTELTFEDSQKNRYTYLLEIENQQFTIKPRTKN